MHPRGRDVRVATALVTFSLAWPAQAATGDTRRTDEEIDAKLVDLRRDLAAEEAKLDDIGKRELYTALVMSPGRARLAGDGPAVDRDGGVSPGPKRVDARIGISAPLRKDALYLSVGPYTSDAEHVHFGLGYVQFFGDQKVKSLHPFLGTRFGMTTRAFSSIPFFEAAVSGGMRVELSTVVMMTIAVEASVPTDLGRKDLQMALDLALPIGVEVVL
ncbi:MAG: hypothetical protein KIT84_17150 [Labilithrix sp.]|nr:hypothetical protein [Labilithrix sp.]MCW5812758.1 hypothetical protein [Labilithrix sp.]